MFLSENSLVVIILQILNILFGYLGSYAIKKRNIFIFYILSNAFAILMFWSVGKTAAVLPLATTGIRYFIFIFKDKYKTRFPLYFCLSLHLLALFFSVNTLEDIIPSLLVIAGCLIYWFLDGSKLKGSVFILKLPWTVYHLYCGLYLVGIKDIAQNIILTIAYFRLKRIEKTGKNNKPIKRKNRDKVYNKRAR